MKLPSQRGWSLLTVFTVLFMFLDPRPALAEDHVVPLAELHGRLRSAAEARATNLDDVERVLSLPAAQDALKKASLNQDQIRKAVSTLNDEELSRLADRARAVEQDVQGGLIVGLLALIGLIVVILVVVIVVTNK